MRPAFLIHPNSKGKPAKLAVVGWLPLRHAVLKTATDKVCLVALKGFVY